MRETFGNQESERQFNDAESSLTQFRLQKSIDRPEDYTAKSLD